MTKFKSLITSAMLGGFLLLFSISCESKPLDIELGENGYNLQSFTSQDIHAFSFQDSVSIGGSARTYIGRLDDSRRSHLLLRINPDTLQLHEICTLPEDSLSIHNAFLRLKTYSTLERYPQSPEADSLWFENDVQNPWSTNTGPDGETDGGSSSPIPETPPTIRAFWLDMSAISPDWNESSVFEFTSPSTVMLGDQLIDLENPDSASELLVHTYQDVIQVFFAHLEPDDRDDVNPISLIGQVCTAEAGDYAILLSETDPEKLIELYSTNYIYTSHVPGLALSYDRYQVVDSTHYSSHFNFLETIADNIVAQTNENDFGGIRLLAFADSTMALLEGDSIPAIIEGDQLDQEIDLFDFNLTLEPHPEDDSDEMILFFQNIHLAQTDFDPADDNFDGEDESLTENNLIFDSGELYEDCGLDNLCNVDEPGYNLSGTEGNGVWDEGELYHDFGPDSLASMDEPDYHSVDNPDPEGDDYNDDPADDNWRDCGVDGLCPEDEGYPGADDGEADEVFTAGERFENNGQYDFVDETNHEIFQDTGLDGLFDEAEPGYHEADNPDPNGDNWSAENPEGTENNGLYEVDEPFLDAGLDGLWNYEEEGYNISGQENNGQYDFGEYFEDCGSDGICDDGNTDDDYNIDPNNDDYNSELITGSEMNFELDWTDTNGNGLWDNGEGERWYDWGTDQLPDSLEQNYGGTNLTTSIGSNYYDWNFMDNPVEEWDIPNSYDDADAALWISRAEVAEGEMIVTVSAAAKEPLHGLQFTLSQVPFVVQDTVMVEQNISINSVDTNKLIDDISLYEQFDYPNGELTDVARVAFGENLKAVLQLNDLNDFIAGHQDVIISKADLTLYMDHTDSLTSHNMRIFVNRFEDPVNFMDPGFMNDPLDVTNILTSSSYLTVTPETDSLVIDVKTLIQDYVVNSFLYNDLQLESDGWGNNFSQVKFYNETAEETSKRPILRILYSQ